MTAREIGWVPEQGGPLEPWPKPGYEVRGEKNAMHWNKNMAWINSIVAVSGRAGDKDPAVVLRWTESNHAKKGRLMLHGWRARETAPGLGLVPPPLTTLISFSATLSMR